MREDSRTYFALYKNMPRKKILIQPNIPVSISARTNNKNWFELPMADVWDIYSDHLYYLRHVYNVQIHNFVLMSNHFHLIASFPDTNMATAMNRFMRETSRAINSLSMNINHLYGGRFFRTSLDSYHYYCIAYKYIYRNPVKAGLAPSVEEYKYSTINGLLGQTHLTIPVVYDTLLFDNDIESQLKWLNTPFKNEHEEAIKKALSRARFKLPKVNNKIHELEYMLP